MNILFFGYWGANEGLSQSTIMPHLEILAANERVKSIYYVSIERQEETSFQLPDLASLTHIPYYSIGKNRLLAKASDFSSLPRFLRKLIRKEAIDLLICRTSLAGGIGYLATRGLSVPFTVESFEPHADYMHSLGIWSKNGISYRLEQWLEKRQKHTAQELMPVTENYKQQLIAEAVPAEKISVMPCAVDLEKFAFDESKRTEVRKQLGISNDTVVGIYVGKFGDIYWDREAFSIFKSAFAQFPDFFLMLLNPQSEEFVTSRCREFGLPLERVLHTVVAHGKVPDYLSASDFAFSFHKPSEYSKAFSPIKNGEYWANGLPVVSPEQIGDDSEIISNEQIGIVVRANDQVDWLKLSAHLGRRSGKKIVDIASRFRSFDIVRSVYGNLLRSLPKR